MFDLILIFSRRRGLPMSMLQSWCVHRGCAWHFWTPSHLNRPAAFPEIQDIGSVSFNAFLMRFLDARGCTIRIHCTLLYQHRGARVQDNPAPVFLLHLRDQEGFKAFISCVLFLQQGNLKVLKTRGFRFLVLVGYFHQLKTESRLLAQCELACAPVCTIYVPRKLNSLPAFRERQTFRSCLYWENLYATVLNGVVIWKL